MSRNHIHNRDLSNVSSFVCGLMIGSVMGVASAILFAPQSGDETRRQINRLSEEAKARGQDAVDNTREKVDAVVSDAYKQAHKVAEAARMGVEGAAESIHDAVQSNLRVNSHV